MQRVVQALIAVASLGATAAAFAAPDEAALGKAEGYPVCPRSQRPETHCLVGLVSHYDEIFQARKVASGPRVHPLMRAAAEPAIRYTYQSRAGELDDYLARHQTAENYVAELKGTPYGETPIRHLLTMSSGVRFSEDYSGNDDLATLSRLSTFGESDGGAATVMSFRTRERPAGERFHYSSAETQVLGLVLRAATSTSLADYLSEKIWQPMGAQADASWVIDKGGYEVALAGVNATVADYARLGMLLANDGALDGRQIIPAAWVRAATTPAAKQFEPGQFGSFFGYGYQTWIIPGKQRSFMLRGLRGQGVFVDPGAKIVMVHAAAGDVGEAGTGELLALWFGVVKSLGK